MYKSVLKEYNSGDCVLVIASGDEPTERPGTVEAELRGLEEEQGDNTGNTSPSPSLALTEGDYGVRTETDTARSTLLRYMLCDSFIKTSHALRYLFTNLV